MDRLKKMPFRKNEQTMTKRVRKGEKMSKKKERVGEGETSSWTEGLPAVRQLSVPHKGELLFECVPSVRACHQVCVCVCVSTSESALHIPSTLDKNSIQSF